MSVVCIKPVKMCIEFGVFICFYQEHSFVGFILISQIIASMYTIVLIFYYNFLFVSKISL